MNILEIEDAVEKELKINHSDVLILLINKIKEDISKPITNRIFNSSDAILKQYVYLKLQRKRLIAHYRQAYCACRFCLEDNINKRNYEQDYVLDMFKILNNKIEETRTLYYTFINQPDLHDLSTKRDKRFINKVYDFIADKSIKQTVAVN
jgi:hypothetical protein